MSSRLDVFAFERENVTIQDVLFDWFEINQHQHGVKVDLDRKSFYFVWFVGNVQVSHVVDVVSSGVGPVLGHTLGYQRGISYSPMESERGAADLYD